MTDLLVGWWCTGTNSCGVTGATAKWIQDRRSRGRGARHLACCKDPIEVEPATSGKPEECSTRFDRLFLVVSPSAAPCPFCFFANASMEADISSVIGRATCRERLVTDMCMPL